MPRKKENPEENDLMELMLTPMNDKEFDFLNKMTEFNKVKFLQDNIIFLSNLKNMGVVSKDGYNRLFLEESYVYNIEDNIMILTEELMKAVKEKIKKDEVIS